MISMLSEQELKLLRTNQRLLVRELQGRGVNVEIICAELQLLEAEYEGHKELLLDRDSSINPYAASVLAGDKHITKDLLRRAGLSVVDGQLFYPDQIGDALVIAQEIGYPVVVKPNFGSHGRGITMGLGDLCSVKTAIDELVESTSEPFLVEQQFDGSEYRIFITRNKDYAVLHRDPAHVIGDGKKTIEELAREETEKRGGPSVNSLCPIRLDEAAQAYLARQDKDVHYVPGKNEKVYLTSISNVAAGGTCEDYTDIVHPSVVDIAKQALDAFPRLPYAGIDMLTKDVKVMQTPENYRIIEVNSNPGLHMHYSPGFGETRPVAAYIADLIFPETKIS